MLEDEIVLEIFDFLPPEVVNPHLHLGLLDLILFLHAHLLLTHKVTLVLELLLLPLLPPPLLSH